MKNALLLSLLAVFCTSPLWADDFGPKQQWIERVEGSLGIPDSSDTTPVLNLAFGGGIALGYRFTDHFSLSAFSGYYQYSLKNIPQGDTGGYFSYVPLQAVATYNFGNGGFRPYVSLGFGAAFNTYNSALNAQNTPLYANAFETSFLVSPAVGFVAVIEPRAALFLEAKMDMDFRANNTLGLADGTPSIFIPIQAGLAFFVI